jgi:hypothetical protein
VRRHRQAHRRVRAGDLLERDDVVEELHARAAVLLGDLHAQQAHLAHGGDDLVREDLLLVPAARVRDDEPLGQLAHRPLEDDLIVAEVEVHGLPFGAGAGLPAGAAALKRASGPGGA